MVVKDDLKQIVILGYLTDEMLAKLLPYVELQTFEEGHVIFREADLGVTFYMLKRGKVLLEQKISDKVRVSVGSIKPGYSFGWSAMLGGEELYTLEAICVEECEVFSISKEAIKRLLDDDHSMGYYLMQRIVAVVKKRLDRRTEQFLRVISVHPDIKPLSDK